MDTQRRYPTDLTDEQWTAIAGFFPAAKPGGRPFGVERRAIVNALLYLVRAGCSWRMLPREYPNWQTVYQAFRTWDGDGTWEHVHTALREQERQCQGRQATPSAAIIDSQSVKTLQKGGIAATMAART